MSFHKKLPHKYLPVPENKRIETLPFLLASSESIIPLLDILGPTAFSMVKSDVNGNIKIYFADPSDGLPCSAQNVTEFSSPPPETMTSCGALFFLPIMLRVRKRYDEDPAKYSTLADIIEVEVQNNTAFKTASTTEAMLWLSRALNFICTLLKNLIEGNVKENSIIPSLKAAYKVTLEVYHNWFVKKGVEVAFHAAPYYSDLIKALSNGEPEETVMKDVAEYQACLQDHVSVIEELFVTNGLDPKK